MLITEPDVTLTDYGLAVECAVFTHLLARDAHREPIGAWFLLFFAATGLAALTGGTVHGFFADERTLGSRILWPATLLLIGGAAFAAWGLGAHLQFPARVARWVVLAAAAGLAGYAVVVLFVSQLFLVAVLHYLPATVFLITVFALGYRRGGQRAFLLGLVALALTLVASGIQQGRIALHPAYFNHNALQHLVQGVALFVLFRSARRLVSGHVRS
jgi:hypothetical protein